MASMKMLVLGMVVMAAHLLQSSAAQTTHVVGDGLGWTVPSGGAADYSTWASKQTFTVGDVLVFNYNTGAHDVATVTKAAFDSCNGTPISIETNGPTNITLSTAGEHFFICTIGQHCSGGQKLAINVTGTSPSPSPSPTSPSPSPSPTSPPPSPATPPSPSAPTPNAPTAPSPSGSTTPPPTPSPSGSTPPPPTPSPSGSTPPPPTPSPSDTTAPPPPNGAPSSLAAAALPVTLLSVALALLH